MSRYIDADGLKEHKFPVVCNDFAKGWNDAFDAILDNAPSIDIVRCGECLWARPRTLKGETGYRCVFYRVDKAEDGYCDNGEREGE